MNGQAARPTGWRGRFWLFPTIATIIGALVFGWPALPILLTYWLEAITAIAVAAVGIARNWASASEREREAFLRARRGEKSGDVSEEETLRRGIAERGTARAGGFVGRRYLTFRLLFGGIMMMMSAPFLLIFMGRDYATQGALGLLGGELGLAGLGVMTLASLGRGLLEVRAMPRNVLPDVASAERRFWSVLLASFGATFLSVFLAIFGTLGIVATTVLLNALLDRAWRRPATDADPVLARQDSFAGGSEIWLGDTVRARVDSASRIRGQETARRMGAGCLIIALGPFALAFGAAALASGDPLFGIAALIPLALLGLMVRSGMRRGADLRPDRHGIPAGIWELALDAERATISGPGGSGVIYRRAPGCRLLAHYAFEALPGEGGRPAGRGYPPDHLDIVAGDRIMVASIPCGPIRGQDGAWVDLSDLLRQWWPPENGIVTGP